MGVIARPAPLALLGPIQYADGVSYTILTTYASGTLLLAPDGATATVTGTGGITEAGDTSTGVGRTTHTGTGAITEAGDTSVGLGGARVTGTGAITEAGDTSTGVGTAGIVAAATGIIVRRSAPTIRGQIAYADAVTLRVGRSSSGVIYLAPAPPVLGVGAIVEAGDVSVGSGTTRQATITGRLLTRRSDTPRSTKRSDTPRTTRAEGH